MPKINVHNGSQIAIVYRPNTPLALKVGEKLALWLKKQSCQVWTAPGQDPLKGTMTMRSETDFDEMDLVIVLGGDGTYLHAARLLRARPIPILGINLGSLGFLTPLPVSEIYPCLKNILKGKGLESVARAMLRIRLVSSKGNKQDTNQNKSQNKNQAPIHEWLALNDLVIERGPSSHLIDLNMHIQNHYVSEIKADGLIIASPTGSTAYNLAAGGPILHPETRSFVATPVAPHSLTSRPLLFPDDKMLRLRLQGHCIKANIIVDGLNVGELLPGFEIQIERHTKDHYIIRPLGHNFYQLLREKLKFGERA